MALAQVARGKGYTIERLLPDQKEFRFFVLLLAGVYVFDGFILRPEAFPSWLGHLVIWVLYAVLIGLRHIWQLTRKETALHG